MAQCGIGRPRDMIPIVRVHRENQGMADGLNGIIARLEQQRTVIDRALTALREVEGIEAPTLAARGSSAPAPRKRGMTAAGRRRVSEALKKRWAAKRASAQGASKAAPGKGGMPAEGRKRLADAMRRRWALAKAAGTTTIRATKKA